MRNTSSLRLPAVSAQAIKSILGSALMRAYVFITAGYYALFFLSSLAGQSDMIMALVSLLVYGFITAESLILYQRKESANFRHLSVFSLIGMIVMALVCLFLTATVITLNMEYSAGTEEIIKLWQEGNLGEGMPAMIATTVSTGVIALSLGFEWKALGAAANALEHKGGSRNWFLPAAILTILQAAIAVGLLALGPVGWMDIVVNAVSAGRLVCLGLLYLRGSQAYKSRI